MKDQINIVIADGQPIFLGGLRQTLESVKDFNIIGEATDGEAALKVITETKPDVAILAFGLPLRDGLEVARTIFSHSLPVNVIFLTRNKTKLCFNAALNLGAKGYVLKDTRVSYLIDAVRAVSRGKCFISPELSTPLLQRNRRKDSLTRGTPAVVDLTSCEKRILILISQSMTSKEIATELFVSVRTVEHHREHIAAKLDLHGTNTLLKFALEHKDELT